MEREYYTCDNRVYCISDGKNVEVTERDYEFIDELITKIENFYPDAYRALCESYVKSSINQTYFKYLMAQRFLKCNFGNLDTTSHDIKCDGVFNFEKVSCPMRGECKYEGKICMPRFNTKLSDAEMRVMKLYYHDKRIENIADLLYLSCHTVKNHIRSAYTKLAIHTRGEFITYASKHQLFG